MLFVTTVAFTLVEISFDKVVAHLLIDSMSFVTHKVPPWLVLSGELPGKMCT